MILNGSSLNSVSLNASASSATGSNGAAVVLKPVTAVGFMGATSSAELPLLTSAGIASTGAYALADAKLPLLTSKGATGAVAAGDLQLITVTGSVTSSGVARGSASLPFLTSDGLVSVGNKASAAVEVQIPTSSGLARPSSNSVAAVEFPALQATGALSNGTVSTTNAVLPQLVSLGVMYHAGDLASENIIPHVVVQGAMRNVDRAKHSGWALNMENGAATEYRGWDFNSLTTFKGVPLAADATGIYSMDAADDGGLAIDARARTGVSDLGAHQLKRVRDMWVGCRANGPMAFRTITDEQTQREYIMSRVDTGSQARRVKLGRGVKSRYWQFEVANIEGADFQLESLVTEPEILTRRVG